jgi:polar amino acid transport system substrate-binding protein
MQRRTHHHEFGRDTVALNTFRQHLGASGVVVAAAALLLAGCGSSNSGSTATKNTSTPAPSSSKDAALAAKVPASIASDGKIVVGTDSTYAPSEFLDTDGKTIIGFDVDLFKAVAQKLGLQAQFVTAPFGNIITGVNSGKYEIGVSSFTINPDRLKQANMVSYYSAGTLWAAKKGNPNGIDPNNACGKRIAVQKDTVEVDDITARSKKCTDAGKPAIQVDQYAAQSQATASIISGKDEAGLADSPVMSYAVKQTNGQLETLGAIYGSAPYGYVTKKDQIAFAQALASAVKELIADGTYTKVLQKWGVQAGAIKNPTVNPKVS